jgi:hypothetical protein
MGGFIDDSSATSSVPAASLPVRRRGLLEKQVTCPGGGSTRVSGTVYIPSGQLPLYNVMVYVPDADLRPFTPGASCTCEITGEPIASALTDANGRFVLENVPVGSNIPLVIQVGDWRREFNIGTVKACADNPIADQTLRLPARQSEGDIPRIAVATGQVDALECLVRKLGVDESEFTGAQGGGRVTLFAGQGGTQRYASSNDRAMFPPAEALWSDLESLSRYDVVLMSCDGDRDNLENKSGQALEAMADYLNQGGRVFGSHYQDVWFEHGPAPFPALAEFDLQPDLGNVSAQVVTTFPKGEALSQWLVNAGASPTAGQVAIRGAPALHRQRERQLRAALDRHTGAETVGPVHLCQHAARRVRRGAMRPRGAQRHSCLRGCRGRRYFGPEPRVRLPQRLCHLHDHASGSGPGLHALRHLRVHRARRRRAGSAADDSALSARPDGTSDVARQRATSREPAYSMRGGGEKR